LLPAAHKAAFPNRRGRGLVSVKDGSVVAGPAPNPPPAAAIKVTGANITLG
jgi:hypothetical protein